MSDQISRRCREPVSAGRDQYEVFERDYLNAVAVRLGEAGRQPWSGWEQVAEALRHAAGIRR